MRTENQDIDTEELWLDQDTTAEELLELDSMEITEEIIDLAEHPELADPIMAALPAADSSR